MSQWESHRAGEILQAQIPYRTGPGGRGPKGVQPRIERSGLHVRETTEFELVLRGSVL